MKTRLLILLSLTVFFGILPAAAVDNIEDFYGTWYLCDYENGNGDCVQDMMITIEPGGNLVMGELNNHQLSGAKRRVNYSAGMMYWVETETGLDLYKRGEHERTMFFDGGMNIENLWNKEVFPLYKTERSMNYYGMKNTVNFGEINEEDYIRTWYLDASWDEEAEGYRYALEGNIRSSLTLHADNSFDYTFKSDGVHFEREGYRWETDGENILLTFVPDGEDGAVYTGNINSYGYLVLRDEENNPAMIFWDENPFTWMDAGWETLPKDADVTEDDFCGGYRIVAYCHHEYGCSSLNSKGLHPGYANYAHYAIGDSFGLEEYTYESNFTNETFWIGGGTVSWVEKHSDKYMFIYDSKDFFMVAQRYFPINFG